MSTFGRTLGLGVPAAGLLAVASAKPWFSAAVNHATTPGLRPEDTSIDLPLASALSLLVLAGWGAVLVTGGRARKGFLAVVALATVGVLACVGSAPFTLPGQLRDRLDVGHVAVAVTGWFVAAAVAVVLTLAAVATGWRGVADWPTMSRRYDAPSHTPVAVEPSSPLEMWKAMDEGVDPTTSGETPDP